MFDLLELIGWFLPDIVSIGKAARDVRHDQRAFEHRLAGFSEAAMARHLHAVQPRIGDGTRSTAG